MRILFSIFFSQILLLICLQAYPQQKALPQDTREDDSIIVTRSQRSLFFAPRPHLLATHVDMVFGPGRVMVNDKSGLSVSGTVKGLYMLTGVLYVGMGAGITIINSASEQNGAISSKHRAVAAHIPLGIGFTIGDDRAQIINSIDLLPTFYLETPDVPRLRRFAIGLAPELGFHIRVGDRLHLGLMGKLQLFQSSDRDDRNVWPKYGFAGAGVIMRYD